MKNKVKNEVIEVLKDMEGWATTIFEKPNTWQQSSQPGSMLKAFRDSQTRARRLIKYLDGVNDE